MKKGGLLATFFIVIPLKVGHLLRCHSLGMATTIWLSQISCY